MPRKVINISPGGGG